MRVEFSGDYRTVRRSPARVALSERRTPRRRITSPALEASRRIYSLVGRIFMRSVHQRNERLGDGYPRPIKFTQNVPSISGAVVATVIGSPNAAAASSISDCTVRMWLMTSGDSTNVSFATMCTGLVRAVGGKRATRRKRNEQRGCYPCHQKSPRSRAEDGRLGTRQPCRHEWPRSADQARRRVRRELLVTPPMVSAH